MWKQVLYLSCLVVAGCSDIADREYPEPQPAPAATTDSQATVQTRNLLGNLRSIAENGGTLFGHQCSSLYGIGWSGDVDRSDVKSCLLYTSSLTNLFTNVKIEDKNRITMKSVAWYKHLMKKYHSYGSLSPGLGDKSRAVRVISGC